MIIIPDAPAPTAEPEVDAPTEPDPIPLVDLRWQHARVAEEVDAGFARVMGGCSFTDGADVAAFEAAFAEFSGARHVIGCASGTDAIELALRASWVGAGDEVILPANTFVATAEAVLRIGAAPRFVDVDPDTLLIDPELIDRAVTEQTTAVVPVHLYGQQAPMAKLHDVASAYGLMIVADAAQAQGSTQDGAGIAAGIQAAATSFYPGKNLGAYGDAGAVVTDDDTTAALARSIGHHGVDGDRYQHARLGFTSRLDTLQAVVLSAKLRRLALWNDWRRDAADRYHRMLADLDGVVLPREAPGNHHVWHLYTIRVPEHDRDAVLDALHAEGIGAGIHYPVPLHLQGVFASLGLGPGSFPVAEAAAASMISLPIFPGITELQQTRVVDVLRRALAAAPTSAPVAVGAGRAGE